jgi:hypothetical protein
MKEKFRNWNPRSKICVKYTDSNGQKNIWESDTEELCFQIKKIANNYMYQDIKLTNRQLYYQLVAKDLIPNALEIYKRICKLLTDMRYAGELDWDSIEDRGRVPKKHAEWDSVKDLIESAVHSYRLPRWDDQNYYIELYCEKQAMESILKPIADKYHIYFGYNKGYSSASTVYELSKRVSQQIFNGKKVVILYLGDHDPSGIDMVRDIKERLIEFFTMGDDLVLDEYEVRENFQVKSIALTKEQIETHNPPPNPAKITDPRAKNYIKEHGQVSWELDSLDPESLIEITEDGIAEFLDKEKYEEVIQKEKNQITLLREFGDKISDDE